MALSDGRGSGSSGGGGGGGLRRRPDVLGTGVLTVSILVSSCVGAASRFFFSLRPTSLSRRQIFRASREKVERITRQVRASYEPAHALLTSLNKGVL